jgi:hypothetical protein
MIKLSKKQINELVSELLEFIILFGLGSLFVGLLVGHFDYTGILLIQDLFQIGIMWLYFSILKGIFFVKKKGV